MPDTYILRSLSYRRYYIGSAADVDKRLVDHNNGLSRSTKPYRPWKIVWKKKFLTLSEARKLEIAIKRKKSRRSIERFINQDLNNYNN